MKNLILHIGSHKTGTTSIQRALLEAEEPLKNCNYELFKTQNIKGNRSKSGDAWGWIDLGKKKEYLDPLRNGLGGKVPNPKVLTEYLFNSRQDNIIMSSEGFSWIFDDNEIKTLHNFLNKKFKVRIIVYLRRQDKQIISHHQQGAKTASLPACSYYGGTSRAIPHTKTNYYEYLDYNKKMSKWANHFGTENIIIRVFEKDRLKNNDVVCDFMNSIGLSHINIASLRMNESDGFERTKIGHLLNMSNLDGPISSLIRNSANNSGKSSPSREDAMKFYEKYRKSNIDLNRTFNICPDNEAIFDDDFSSYPTVSKDLWNEGNSNRAILNIFNAIKELDKLDANFLKNAAIKLEGNDLKLSLELMKMAHLLKPNGPLIKKKLAAYQKILTSQKKIS